MTITYDLSDENKSQDTFDGVNIDADTVEAVLAGTVSNISEVSGNEELWVGDSAATTSVTFSAKGMINSRDGNKNEAVMMGNGNGIEATKVGDVIGTLCKGDGTEIGSMCIQGATYSPNAKFNLLSLPCMMKKGWSLEGNNKGLKLLKDSQVVNFDVIVNTPKGMLFCLRMKRNESEVGAVIASKDKTVTFKDDKTTKVSISKLHGWLGHGCEEQNRITAKHLGFEISRGSLTKCASCATAKAKRK